MFEQFSSSYYLGRLYVEPTADRQARMSEAQHAAINRQLYRSDEGAAGPLGPIVMKVGRRHFQVRGAPDVLDDRLTLPGAATEIEDAETRPVLLAKASRADQLLEFATGEGDDGAQPRDPFVPDAIQAQSRPDLS